jgi:trehalose synthase
VVQKSLREGFGLTVTEAMWKGRAVVASKVGGIQDQIGHQREGLLLANPTDLPGLGSLLAGLLRAPETADQLGVAAKRKVTTEFLGDRHLRQYAELLTELLG